MEHLIAFQGKTEFDSKQLKTSMSGAVASRIYKEGAQDTMMNVKDVLGLSTANHATILHYDSFVSGLFERKDYLKKVKEYMDSRRWDGKKLTTFMCNGVGAYIDSVEFAPTILELMTKLDCDYDYIKSLMRGSLASALMKKPGTIDCSYR